MSEREYIVTLKAGVDYEAFNQEMIATTGAGDIPSRSVDVANARPGSKRNTHYALTDEEAVALRNDDRVVDVQIPPEQRSDIEIGLNATQVGDFTKTFSDSGNFINWGLRRCISPDNPYGENLAPADQNFNYTLDGTGVDVVIQDSGIQVDHPEFQDADGVSRVQQINWYTESGISGVQSPNHYRDFDGHGTHCAGIAAGKTYGWAKNARIYSVKVGGLEAPSDSGSGIPVSDCFDVIKLWHRNKPVDPATGQKRPTIVNMSWGYGTYFSAIDGGVYRGTPWTGTTRDTSKGMVGVFNGLGYRFGIRVASVDADVEEMIDEGIHVCVAAGNSYQKVDVEGGLDYNNYFLQNGVVPLYYNRGGSPFSTRAHIVGNADASTFDATFERKAGSSETGPGVSVYAPGTNIMSATSTTNRFTDGAYPADNDFRICNISGTSMAAPQVCGLGACVLQLNPDWTPERLLEWINGNAQTGKLNDNGNDADYTNNATILGGNNRYLYQPFNSPYVLQIRNV